MEVSFELTRERYLQSVAFMIRHSHDHVATAQQHRRKCRQQGSWALALAILVGFAIYRNDWHDASGSLIAAAASIELGLLSGAAYML